ncbi:MAG: hypothetical protein ACREP9_08465, partial [Candidatus Dormibacteraceae bacterium]
MNWAILPNGTNGAIPTTYPVNPLPRLTIKDPQIPTNVYDYDTTYLGNSSPETSLTTSGSSNADGSYYTAVCGGTRQSSTFLYRTRYLEWVYFGVNSAAPAQYAIRDVLGSVSGSTGAVTDNGTTTNAVKPFSNGLSNVNRIQTVKIAAIKTWLNYQTKVFWAFRILSDNFSGGSVPSATNSPATVPIPGGAVTSDSNGVVYPSGGGNNSSDSNAPNWYLLNGDTNASGYFNGVLAISKCVAHTGTPLTASTAQEYIQFSDKNNPFQRVETVFDKTGVLDN